MEPSDDPDKKEDVIPTDLDVSVAPEEATSHVAGKSRNKPIAFATGFVVLVVVVIVVGMLFAARPDSAPPVVVEVEEEPLLTEEQVAAYRQRLLQDVEVSVAISSTTTDLADEIALAPLSDAEVAALEQEDYASLAPPGITTPPAVKEVTEVDGRIVGQDSEALFGEDVIAPMTDEELETFLMQHGVDGPGTTQVHNDGDQEAYIVNPFAINGLSEATIAGTVLSIIEVDNYFILRDGATGRAFTVVVDGDTHFYIADKQASLSALSATDSVEVAGEKYLGDTVLYADRVTITGTQNVVFVAS